MLSAVLLLLYFAVPEQPLIQVENARLYLTTSASWLALVIFSGLGWLITRQDYLIETTATYLIDIVAIVLLAYACGGIPSGLLYLTLPMIAMAGLSLPSRFSLLVASVATLGVLGVQTLVALDTPTPESPLFQGGLLGVTLFLTSLAFNLARDLLRKAEATAKESTRTAEAMRAMNESIIARMQTGILVVDEKGRISLSNSAAMQLLTNPGTLPDDIIGRSIYSIDKLGDKFKLWRDNPAQNEHTFTSDFSGTGLEAHFRSLQQGEQTYSLIFLDDTRQLRQRAQQLKIGSLGKLSAGLAHEVRNPLSAINQANDILSESQNLGDEERKLTAIIDRHCHRMNDIIDVVQQLSRRVEPRKRTIKLQEFILEVIDEVEEVRGYQTEIEVDVDESVVIQFDPANLRQVLFNVIDNGLRHSLNATGAASLKIRIGSPAESRHLFLDIEDAGPGVPRKIVRSIFDPFFTTGSQGSGLGLYVSRELCEANFGAIHYVYNDRQTETGFFRISFWMTEESIPA